MLGTIDELRVLVEDASRTRPHLTSRLEKAAFLLLLRPIEQVGSEQWRVGSEDGLRFYSVRQDQCECSDFVRHGRGHLCKHRIAIFFRRSLDGDSGQPIQQQSGSRREQRPDLIQAIAAELGTQLVGRSD